MKRYKEDNHQDNENTIWLKHYYHHHIQILHIFISGLIPMEHMLLFLDQEFELSPLSIHFHWIWNYLSVEMFVRMLTVHCDQNNSYRITINGFQVRKINELRNIIFSLRYGKPSSALRPTLGCSPSWVLDEIIKYSTWWTSQLRP